MPFPSPSRSPSPPHRPIQPFDRRLIGVATAVFGTMGVARTGMQLVVRHLPLSRAPRMLEVMMVATLPWIVVTIIVAWSWRLIARPPRFLAFHVLMATVVCFLEPLLLRWIVAAVGGTQGSYASQVLLQLDTNLLFYVAITASLWAIDHRQRAEARALDAARLELLAADARLHALALQLQPHFLFNTLNLISQLVYGDRALARAMLDRLRGLLRQSLEHASQREVALRDELAVLDAYIEIQKARFGPAVAIDVHLAPGVLGACVPHLLLQPLVENAIRHGIGGRRDGGRIDVSIDRSADVLRLRVADNGVGLPPRVVEGIGLRNSRRRLERLYENSYTFALGSRPDGGTVVSVEIPWREAPAELPQLSEDALKELPTPAAQRRGWLQRFLTPALVAAVCGGVSLLWTELDAATRFAFGGPFVLRGSAALSSAINATLWFLLAPLVIWLARRLEGRRFAWHLPLAAGVAFAHVATWMGILAAIRSPEHQDAAANMGAWGLWDFVAYFAIVAFTLVSALTARRRETLLAMERTRAQLAEARLDALRLRLQPVVLFSGLDAVARDMDDPERCERTIARMGDLLRLLLANADNDSTSLSDEVELFDAYLETVYPSTSPLLSIDEDMAEVLVPVALLAPIAAATPWPIVRLAAARHERSLIIDLFVGGSFDTASVERGWSSVRARLHSLYGDAYVLSPFNTDEGGRIRVALPLPALSSSIESPTLETIAVTV